MGWPWILTKGKQIAMKKTGLLAKRFPINPPFKKFISLEAWRSQETKFFFNSRERLNFSSIPEENLRKRAQNILTGKIRFFQNETFDLGTDYDWKTHPVTGYKYPANIHWTQIDELDKQAGDIKFVWEKSRFSYLYDIVRYDHHFNEDHANFVFAEIRSWIDHNPVNQGPNYICGQETGIRLLNWMFFLNFYKNSSALNEDLFDLIMHSVYWQLHRIYNNIGFTLKLVRNNHAITEAAALYIGGMLFPFLSGAEVWEQKGKNWFEQEIAYQVYRDGTYLQFSMNYHRVVVQLLAWVIRLSELNNRTLEQTVFKRAAASLDFLSAACRTDTGLLPLYGANDGALFFPLNNCRYRDFRSQLNALNYAINKHLLYEDPCSREDVQWLFNPEEKIKRENEPMRNGILSFPEGGFYLFSETDALTFIRCGRHRDRPSHADNLHLDIWYAGENLLHDAGTYLYNTEEQFISFFTGSEGHNTVKIGDFDQMQKGPRFIWLDWSQAVEAESTEDKEFYYFKGIIHAFSSLGKNIYHERSVKKAKGRPYWEVEDRINNKPDLPIHQIWHPVVQTKNQLIIKSYDADGNLLDLEWRQGWVSDHYGEKQESPYFVFSTGGSVIKTIIQVV